MRLLCSALLSANLLLGSSFSLLSPYHFLCQDNILPKNIFSFERTFVLSETPAESTPAADSSDVLNLSCTGQSVYTGASWQSEKSIS